MGPTERGIRSLIEVMREGEYDPKGGRPVPTDMLYAANTITYAEYQQILTEQQQERRAYARGMVAQEMSAESDALCDRMLRAGVPSRFASCAVDRTQARTLADGRWVCVHGTDVERVTSKACALMKGWMSENRFGTARFERTTTACTSFMGDGGQDAMLRLSSAGMLLLSGLGSEVPSDFALSKLAELMERRLGDGMPMVVTTRFMPDGLASHLGSRGNDVNARGIVEMLRSRSVLVEA